MKTLIVSASVAALLLSGAAMAQTSTTNPNNPAPAQPAPGAVPPAGSQTAPGAPTQTNPMGTTSGSTTTAPSTMPSTTAPSTTTTAPRTTNPTATMPSGSSSTTMARADGWLGTQVWKQGVFDPQNTRIGEVDDLVINTSGQITHALIGVGGFLGIGEKTVSVPFSSLKPMNRDGRIWFELAQTKEQLNSAPAFDMAPYKR